MAVTSRAVKQYADGQHTRRTVIAAAMQNRLCRRMAPLQIQQAVPKSYTRNPTRRLRQRRLLPSTRRPSEMDTTTDRSCWRPLSVCLAGWLAGCTTCSPWAVTLSIAKRVNTFVTAFGKPWFRFCLSVTNLNSSPADSRC
jgi:hypothetical protein